MRPVKLVCLISLVIFTLSICSFKAFALVKKIYQSDEPHEIITGLGNQTVLLFNEEIEFAGLGNDIYFDIEVDGKLDKLVVTPKIPGANTNLIVITVNGYKHVFHLFEASDRPCYDLVEIISVHDVDFPSLIEIANKGRISMDPALKNVITIYDIPESKTYNFKRAGITMLNILPKRVLTIKNLNKTLFWIRIENPYFGNNVGLPVNGISFKNRNIYAIASDKEILQPGDIMDIYFFLEGCWVDSSSIITFKIDNVIYDCVLDNIPFAKKDFKLFLVDDNDYLDFTIDDYIHYGGN